MPGDEHDSFADMLRSIAREVSDSVERAATELDLDQIAGTIGVDPDRAREWVDTAGEWLSAQVERFGEEMAARTGQPDRATPSDHPDRGAPAGAQRPSAPAEDPLRRAGSHPLDLPTEEQGMALAALDSGRWTIEPGTEMLVTHGEGPGPSDSLGLVRELRARDWIGSGGEITLAGRHALGRWLDAIPPR